MYLYEQDGPCQNTHVNNITEVTTQEGRVSYGRPSRRGKAGISSSRLIVHLSASW